MPRAPLALSSLLGVWLLGTPLAAQAVTFSDANFADSDWGEVEVTDTSGLATFASAQQVTGGNPAAFRQTTHSVPGGSQSIILDHVYLAGQYDPSIDGAIASVDFSLDVRFISGSTGTSQVGHELILVQGGAHYFAPSTLSVALGPGGGQPGAWSSHSFTGLTAASFARFFGSGPAQPDFSASGAPIQFGYLTLNTSIAVDIATTSGADNWSVVVTPLPEPRAVALLAAAALGVLWRSRAHRRTT